MPQPTMENKNESKQLASYDEANEELPSKELAVSEWYLRHKIRLERIGIGILVAWCALTIGYSMWKWGEYLFVGAVQDQELQRESQLLFSNYEAVISGIGSTKLEISQPQIFKSSSDRYDFVSYAANPSERYVAFLRYKFVFPEGETDTATIIVFPKEKRPIAVFGVQAAIRPKEALFVRVEEKYKRIDPHKIANVDGYIKDRLKFTIDQLSFTERLTGDGVSVPRVTFDLYNDSAYSYWQPMFYVELLSQGSVVGVSALSVDQFRAGDKRPIDIRLFGDVSGVTDIRLYPSVNIFDPSVFMKPGE